MYSGVARGGVMGEYPPSGKNFLMIKKFKARIVPPVRNEEIDMQGRRKGAIQEYCN